MSMVNNSSKKLEEQLREVGKELAQFPTQVDELLSLLNKAENLLACVDQSPSSLISNAYSQILEALVAEPLLRHKDVDVQVAVASCINELIIITAPDAPYSDNQMKEVFQLIVSSFENLCDISSRSYEKRVDNLKTVAKVKSGILMLDLDCNGLLLEMFQHFQNSIRDFHPEEVFIFMKTIMSYVLEENDDYSLSLELLTPILASLKRDNEEICTSARKLGESVLENCTVKIKPHLKQAVKSLGLPLDGYSEIVATICYEPDDKLHIDLNSGINVSVQKANEIKLTCVEPQDVVNSNSSLLNSGIPYFLHPINTLVKEKPEAAELMSKPFRHDDEVVAIDKNDQAADGFCNWNFRQISEKPEAVDLESKPFRHDDEIVTIDKNDRAPDDFCIWKSGQIPEKPEAAELVSKPFGHDDGIVAIEKNDQAADDLCIRNFGPISEKREVAELVSKPFGHDDEIVAIDENDRAADDSCIRNFGQISEKPNAAERLCRLFGHDFGIVAVEKNGQAAVETAMQIDNTSSGDIAPAFEKELQSQFQSTTSGRTTKSKNDNEQSPKSEQTIVMLAGVANETDMPALKRRWYTTTEKIETVIDNNTASGDNSLKSCSQSQATTSKRTTKLKNDDKQSSKLEETVGILQGSAGETDLPASKRIRHLIAEDIQTEIHNAVSRDNTPTKSKNDNEQSIKLEKSIGILVEALKDIVENKKIPIPVDELWGFIREMKLDDDLAGDAFVFLLDRPVQLKGLIFTPIAIRKSILLKMMMRDAK